MSKIIGVGTDIVEIRKFTDKPYLGNKNVVFMTNGSAISYAESYMGYIEGYKLATIIGQPTAGTNGNTNPLILPILEQFNNEIGYYEINLITPL